MLRKIVCLLMLIGVWCFMSGCVATKTLHCDHCFKEVTVSESSNMEEEWIIYCPECNEALFGDDPLLGNG